MYAVSAVPIKPVRVQLSDLSDFRFAATVEDLMRMLMSERWPAKGSAPFRKAVGSCLDAMSLQEDGDTARGAFIDAARAAGISLYPDDDKHPAGGSWKKGGPGYCAPLDYQRLYREADTSFVDYRFPRLLLAHVLSPRRLRYRQRKEEY